MHDPHRHPATGALIGMLTVEHVAGPGPTQAPVALLLHGFTQNRRCWGEFAGSLGQRYSVWGLDLPGHGTSGFASAGFAQAADLVALTTAALPFPVDTLLGYSMGGRLALTAALDNPGIAARLVLIGATAGVRTDEERSSRLAADHRLAARLRAEGPASFLDSWLALPLFEGLSAEQQRRSERLDLWGRGVPETLELRGTGSMEPLWERLVELAMPVRLIAGSNDRKFSQLGQKIAVAVGPNATFYSVANVGHACHLEAPAETALVIR